MLVVMLVLMIATVSASISMRTVQSELHAAGEGRMAQQAQNVSDAAMTSTIAWMDELGASQQWQALWNGLQAQAQAAPTPTPAMALFGDPNIPTMFDRNFAIRTAQAGQAILRDGTEMAPVGAPDPGGMPPDLHGSFGPRQAYVPDNFVVDFTDCAPAPGMLTPGMPSPPPPGSPQRYYCTLIARARLQLQAGDDIPQANQRTWTFGAGGPNNTYIQNQFWVSHEERVRVLTPEM